MQNNYSKNKILKNLVYMYFMSTGVTDPKKIYVDWDTHEVLKDYKKPSIIIIQNWLTEFMQETAGQMN